MKKLITISLLSALLYSGCSGVPVLKLPRGFNFEEPKAELFPVGSKYDKVLGGKLAGQGADFEKAAAKYKIPVKVLISICLWETGGGKSRAIRVYRNCSGSMRKGKLIRFGSVAESIEYTARNLRLNYYDKGLNTVAKIRRKYAPYNPEWTAGVNKIMNKLP